MVSKRFAHPWLTGWAAANALRDTLQLDHDHVFDGALAKFCAKHCGWPLDQQVRVVNSLPEPSGLPLLPLDIHARSATKLPLVITTRSSPQAHQFRIARSLYYSLVAGREVQELEAIVDVQNAPMFSEASAFAAELLVPASYLRQNMPPDGVWDTASVDRLASMLVVSPLVVRHQIMNRELGELDDIYD